MAQVSQKSIHEEAAKSAAKLVREPIEFWSPDKQDYEGYPIFEVCRYKSREGIIEAKFNKGARPFLLQLREHFTQYRLEQAIPLSTPYAIRTYEISKMIERPGTCRTREIPVERFRRMFRLENKYKRHCDMRRRVVDPSVKEVNRKTDVTISCDDVREGQTPVALKWVVKSKSDDVVEDDEVSEGSSHSPGPPKVDSQKVKAKYQLWFEALDEEKQKEVLEEAKRRASNAGYKEGARSFEAGVQVKIGQIHKELN